MGEAVARLDDDAPLVLLDSAADMDALPSADASPQQAVPPMLLVRLVTYAQQRLQAGVGVDRLRASGMDSPALVEVLGAGFIPSTYGQALAPADTAILGGLDLGDSLLLPAFGSDGALVDAACWRLGAAEPTWVGSLQPAPVGTLALRLPGTGVTVTLVSDLADLTRRLMAGERHVLLLRPDRPVPDQLCDLHARRLKAVRADQLSLAETCRTAGLSVAESQPAAGWQVVAVDRDHRRVVFSSGALTASLSIPAPGSSQVHIDVRTADGCKQSDTIDSAAPRQAAAFAALVERKIQVPPVLVLALLADGLADRLRALAAEPGQAMPFIPAQAGPGDLDAVLTDSALIGRFQSDADTLGWVCDAQAKTLVLLTLAGLGLDHPPWLVVQGDPAITMPITGMVANLVPADRCVYLARLTDGIVTSQGPDGLRHRLLVIDDAVGLKATTVMALRVLLARGGLAMPVTHRDAVTGRMVSRLSEKQGPVSVLAAASEASPLDDLAVVVRPDDSPEQMQRVLARARRTVQVGMDQVGMSAVCARWQGVLAGLPRLPVRIPAADRVHFPAQHPRHRVEQDQFFALVEASALLHHQQRAQVDGCLIATEADISLVIDATRGLLGRTDDGLTERAWQLVTLLDAQPDRSITIPQLAEAMPHWTRDIARAVLDELMRAQVVFGPSTGRGRKARPFVLTRVPSMDASGILLLPAGVQLSARNWGTSHIEIPNVSPAQSSDKTILGNWGQDCSGGAACAI